jgi:glycogen synthase
VYADPEQWEPYQRNGMQEDFSWPRFAAQYADIYQSLMDSRNTQNAKFRDNFRINTK